MVELEKDEVSKWFKVFRTNNFVICISRLVSCAIEKKEAIYTYVPEATIL
jgi:hypothetical protein